MRVAKNNFFKSDLQKLDINWLHIIDDKGSPIYTYESYAQGTKESNFALLSHLLFGLKSVALGINNDEI